MLINALHSTMINSPVRSITGKVELYEGSTLVDTFKHTDDLKSFKVERVGEGRFFGYGFVQKVNVKLLDLNREKDLTTDHSFALYLGVSGDYVTSFPRFHITEVNRNEKDNSLSITAYDKLKDASEHTYSELNLAELYPGELTLEDIVTQIANFLGINSVEMVDMLHGLFFRITYTHDLINLEGTETLRYVLDAIAEVTGSIYYLNGENVLVFKRLNIIDSAVLEIDRSKYMELDSKTNRRLKQITKATTLGDNIHISIAATGTNEVIMDNPFYELRDDVDNMLGSLRDSLGMCINQYECDWRGNYLLEIGDKIDLITKDGGVATTYLLDDTFHYDGGMEQKSRWKYDGEKNVDSQPNTIGEAIAQTYAKVDKVNKQIDLVVSEVGELGTDVANLRVTQDEITQTVESQSQEIEGLTERVEQSVTSEEVNIQINKILAQVDNTSVTTTTGFTFNADGLNVEKTGSEMKTTITEDGMKIYRSNNEVLKADNTGVWAEDLHATTYLMIGLNSRFENYDNNTRTGCFWIGEGGANS